MPVPPRQRPLSPVLLPILIFALSVIGVGVSLALSRTFDLVPHCRVFIDGCISISASGRREPAVFVFRASIIPVGMMLVLTCAWRKTGFVLSTSSGQRSG